MENAVGEIGAGWQVAMTTLLHERGTLGFALVAGLESQIRKLITLAKEKGATEVQRDAIAREWIGLQAVRYTNYRSLTTLMKTGIPGPEGSGAKLWWSEANQRVTKLALELLGSGGAAPERERERAAGLLAAPAAALARQHDRGRHLRDPAQHHRRARARPPEVALMEFAFSQEQEELRREARSFLEANPEAPLAELRELGWLGVSVPEERGGGGLSFVDEAILFEEAGRALYSGPFLTTAVVLPALPEVDENAWSVEVDGLVPAPGRRRQVLREDMTAVPAEGETLATVDETRPLGRLCVAGTRGSSTATSRPCGCGCSPRLRVEAVGVAQKALELGVAYVSDREQFGKKIGTYQAVSHPLADSYVETELARSLAYWAAWCVAGRRRAGAGRGRRREGAGGRDRRRRVRAVDPGARRHRLHLGARPAPLLQARAVDRRVRRPRRQAAPGRRCSSARLDKEAPCPSRKRKCSS